LAKREKVEIPSKESETFRIATEATRGGAEHQTIFSSALAMPEQDTELAEVCFGQVGQNFCINRIFAERLFVLLEAEASQPRGNVHDSSPSPEFAQIIH
jgi:hypothetical protein